MLGRVLKAFSFVLTLHSVFPLSNGATTKAGPPVFGSGWTGGPAVSSSMSSGYSGLGAVQQGEAAQSLNLQASGWGMGLGLTSIVSSDGYTNVATSGGNSGQGSADVNDSSGVGGIVPESIIELGLVGSDNVDLHLDSHVLGWEHLETVVEQEAQVSSVEGGGGWGTVTSTGGWPAVATVQHTKEE